ncbi:MAG: Endo,4-beta-xylanase precursor [Labilithrix sp.]|nr:Endo,4-beta-xylanase precursor [Labilithrix sp.]
MALSRLARASLASASLSAFVVLLGLAPSAAGCGGGDTDSGAATPAPGSADPSNPETGGGSSGSSGPGTTDDGGATDGAAPPLAEGELAKSYVDFDVNHVLSTGQSNSVANGGSPPLASPQPYTNLMFDTGVMPMGNCDAAGCTQFQTPTSFVPLVDGDKFFGYGVETASSGIANEISKLATGTYQFGTKSGVPAKHDVLVSLHGRSGNTYWCLRKNSCNYHADSLLKPFTQGMMEVQAAKDLATAASKTYVVRAVTAIHGESDHYGYAYKTPEFPMDGTDGTPGKIKDYADGLLEWQQDYESGVKAITGQTIAVPLLISQLSGWTDEPTSKISQMQLSAHTRAPGKVVLVTPTYMLDVREDCLHFSATGQRHLGEYFAKAYAKMIFQATPWEPVRPLSITRAGTVVTVKFSVPRPPLVFDTTLVTDPGRYGFDVVDDAGALLPVTSVALAGPDAVAITLAAAPAGAIKVRYAQNQPSAACIGPGTTQSGGARGNLHDSDKTPSQYGYDLSNWAVAFELPVN